MTARDYLRQVKQYDMKAQGIKQEIEEMRSYLQSVHAMNYQKPRVQQSADGDRMTDQLSKIEEKQNYFEQCVIDYVSYKQNVLEEIMQLSAPHFEILRLHYLDYVEQKEIAVQRMVQWESAHRYLQTATKAFYEMFKDVHGFESAL